MVTRLDSLLHAGHNNRARSWNPGPQHKFFSKNLRALKLCRWSAGTQPPKFRVLTDGYLRDLPREAPLGPIKTKSISVFMAKSNDIFRISPIEIMTHGFFRHSVIARGMTWISVTDIDLLKNLTRACSRPPWPIINTFINTLPREMTFCIPLHRDFLINFLL
jgi:hypothetical protein